MVYEKLVEKKIDKNITKILENPFLNIPTIDESIEISRKYGIALHPRYTLYWNELSTSKLITFLEKLKKIQISKDFSSKILNENIKEDLENLGIEHDIYKLSIDEIKNEAFNEEITISELYTKILLVNLGIDIKDYSKLQSKINELIDFASKNLSLNVTEILSKNNSIEIRDKGGSYIGARMGRPEKAKMRKLDGRPHGLFPIGDGKITKTKEFGSNDEREEIKKNRLKNIVEAVSNGNVETEFCIFYCEKCNIETIYPRCQVCDSKTSDKYFERYTYKEVNQKTENSLRYKRHKLELQTYINNVRKIIGEVELPKLVKGVDETINKHRISEHMAKAFLRAKNEVYVNKDGTIRFDMIEMGITHFRPKEIGTSIEKLKELGYEKDMDGNEIVNEDQLVEILPQDVILPDCTQSGDELASDFVIKTSRFVDDELEKFYSLKRFYNFKTKEDTIGHLIIGLAPHTSAGIVGRIIGYSKTQGCFSHPVWHAAQRRNLDGDENGIILLVDALINFSRDYLPDRRGSRTMDTSLVLTSHLYLDQIDDEVHGMDIVSSYPLEFYRGAKEYRSPKEFKIEKVEKRIDNKDVDNKYLNYKFTHDNYDLNDTILCSSYKTLPTMSDKLKAQLELGRKIRAVDENQVGSFVIDKHFMKDIKGNLRKFSMQSFRCTKCNTIFRRPPLVGKCTNCGESSINFTIAEGSIKKYLNPSFEIINNYEIDPYIVETIELVNLRIEGVFGKEKEKQKDLNSFFG